MDELQILNKRSDFDDISISSVRGTGRLRAKDGGIQNIKNVAKLYYNLSERPITSMSCGGGAVNRVIEIECNGGKFFKKSTRILQNNTINYGHAGKEFVDNLTEISPKHEHCTKKYIKLLER